MSEEMKPQETGELRGIERMLRQVAPAPHGINRDALLYEAGRAAQRSTRSRTLRLWQSAFAAMLGISAALFAVAMQRGAAEQPLVREHIVFVHDAAPAAPDSPPAMLTANTPPPSAAPAAAYLAMRRNVLAAGLGVLDRTGNQGGQQRSLPALRINDGLDALPTWQKHLANFDGDHS